MHENYVHKEMFIDCHCSAAPSASPRNIIVQAISSTSIRVSWQPPSENDQNGIIIGYQLWVNSSSDPTNSLIQVQGLTVLVPGRAILTVVTKFSLN